VDDPYEKLEAKLYANYQKCAWQQTSKLFDLPDFSNSHPSVLMDQILNVALCCAAELPFLALFL
jgi:hypothetical protein